MTVKKCFYNVWLPSKSLVKWWWFLYCLPRCNYQGFRFFWRTHTSLQLNEGHMLKTYFKPWNKSFMWQLNQECFFKAVLLDCTKTSPSHLCFKRAKFKLYLHWATVQWLWNGNWFLLEEMCHDHKVHSFTEQRSYLCRYQQFSLWMHYTY